MATGTSMKPKNQARDDVMNYAHTMLEKLGKSESLTSHLFIAGIYHLTDINPLHLLPQSEFETSSRRGLIDYVYMPPMANDLNVFIELKKYNSISRESDHTKQVLAYLRSPFPSELTLFERKDNWRLGILTDLVSTYLYLRKKQWGNTTQVYSLPCIQSNSLAQISNLFDILNEVLKLPVGLICHRFLWENLSNRFQILATTLSDENSSISRLAYAEWLKIIGSSGGRGWPKHFVRTFEAAYDSSKHTSDITFDQIEGIKKSFNDKHVRKEIKNLFITSYNVDFGKGNDPLVFK